MHTKLLLLAAVALSTAACQQEKPADITAAVPEASHDTAVVVADTVGYHDDARRLTDRVATDLKLEDAEARRRMEYAYYTRNRRRAELESQYAVDTAGRYTAYRTLNDDTDREIRTIVTDPTRYHTYETNRTRYYEGGPYTAGTSTTTTSTSATTTSKPARRGSKVVSYENDGGDVKIEYANGTKVKIDKDGDRKVKYPNGTKVKTDADDGERKVKQ